MEALKTTGGRKQQVKYTMESDGIGRVKETVWLGLCTHTKLSQQNWKMCLAVCTGAGALQSAVFSKGLTHVILYVQRCGKPNVLFVFV